MATLEIHDAEARVRFVDLDRDHPVLFGSGAACDIVLSGAGVLPVHGRVRWRGRKFKIDASPDAEFLEINGRKIVSASLRQGDEIRVGPCRLFVLRLEAPAHGGRQDRGKRRPKAVEADEPTQILQGPPKGRDAASATATRRPALFEKDDLLAALDLDDGPEAAAEGPPIAPAGPGRRASGPKEPGAVARLIARLRGSLEDEAAPGREKVAASPTVLMLAGLLVVLVAMGFWLNAIILRTIATRTYDRAVQLLEDGDNATAIREFDSFLARNPEDRRSDKARTLRALANVRQYIAVSGATWSRALEAAGEMVDSVGDLAAYRDEKSELGDLTIRIGEGLADRARRNVDARSLAEAEAAVKLHARIAGESAPAFLTKSRLPGLIDEARAAIRKAETRASALAAMDQALGRGSAAAVYQARDDLVLAYADLSKDAQVVDRMVKANDLMRQAAKVDPSRRPAETSERPEPLGPATALVERSRLDPLPAPLPAETIVYALADGAAYAIEGSTGAPLWRVAVGLDAPSSPSAVPGDATALLFDARHHELQRRDARTGRLVWRQEVGESVDSAPLVIGQQVYQTSPGGRLLVLDLDSGELVAALDLGFPITRTPVVDESGRFLYVMGKRDCLFTISRDPLACVDVQYLGHADGSILCPPARLGRFLVVAENDRIADGRWRVFRLDEDGAKPHAVQSLDVAGWTWGTPPTSGSSIWSIGDRGGIEVFAAGDYSSPNPLRSLARLAPDAEEPGPTFGLAATEREVWIASRRAGRYDLDAEAGRLASRFMLGDLGPPAAPVQVLGRRIVLSFQSQSGGVSLLGLDPSSGKADWETVVGGGWPIRPVASAGDASLVGVDRSGRRFEVSRADLDRGGFVTTRLPRPGDPRTPNAVLQQVEREGRAVTVLAPQNGGTEVWAESAASSGSWDRASLPSPAAAVPIPWAGSLFVPAEDGRAYLLDPATGRPEAEPFVPRFERDRSGRWLVPAPLDNGSVILADDSGRVRRLGLEGKPSRRIVIEAEATLDVAIESDPACTRNAVILATADGSIRSLAARDLSPVGAWKLDAPLLGPPVAVGDQVVALDRSGGVTLFGPDGRREWTASLGAPAVGPPLIRDAFLWVLDRNRRAHGLNLQDGREAEVLELGVQPVGGPVSLGPDLLVPSGLGVFEPLKVEASGGAKP